MFLEDFDRGLVETFGAELTTVTLDDEQVEVYAVQIPGVTGPDEYNGLVPVIWMNPEDVFQRYYLPAIVISRSSITPAMTSRWNPVGKAYTVAAGVGGTVVAQNGQRGPVLVETQGFALPFDISYDVHLKGRLRRQADLMLRYMGRFLWTYGQIFFTDNMGEERGYYAFLESIDSLDEVAEMADRTIGHTLSLRVEAELDFSDPVVLPTLRSFGINVEPMAEDGGT